MRDGVRLFTSIYAPLDTAQRHPIIMKRTPYDVRPYDDSMLVTMDLQTRAFLREGYIVVKHDVRGRFMSEGEYADVRPILPQHATSRDVDETTDTYDTVEWLLKNVAGRMCLSTETTALANSVTLAGAIEVEFDVSTSGTDCDWVVKVLDVLPGTHEGEAPGFSYAGPTPAQQMGGYQMLVRGDVLRGKFRNSRSKLEPFVPGQVTHIRFRMNDVYHTFQPGHRIMVQVQSSWFPMNRPESRSVHEHLCRARRRFSADHTTRLSRGANSVAPRVAGAGALIARVTAAQLPATGRALHVLAADAEWRFPLRWNPRKITTPASRNARWMYAG
jgi:predicted acyl esterase